MYQYEDPSTIFNLSTALSDLLSLGPSNNMISKTPAVEAEVAMYLESLSEHNVNPLWTVYEAAVRLRPCFRPTLPSG
jgi:hypothetical protein